MTDRNSRLEQLRKFLENDPNDPFLHYAMAIELEARGEKQTALKSLQTLQSDHPYYTATYYHLGRLLSEFGQSNEAIAMYKEGIRRTKLNGEKGQLAELQSALNNLLYEE